MAHRSEQEVSRSGISAAYRQELLDTFQLYDPDGTGKLSTHNLRLAMRTLGFEASQKDVDEIVLGMPSLSVHKKGKASTRRERGNAPKVGPDKTRGKTTEAAIGTRRRRRSVRSEAAASKKGQPKYVDSEDDKGGYSEDDDNEDAYGQSEGDGAENDDDDDDDYDDDDDDDDDEMLYFTLQDFVTIMTPSESQHGQDEVSRAFQLFDGQDKGVIRLEDLRRVASELGMSMTDSELREMIEEADKDGDGGVNEQEFARIMKKVGL
ncbi:hypothetical protein BGZ67_010424 [Mortierella alpina]|nr:hypothetical protein BGZ67_010424 [Mortierella alpina]